MIYGIGTDIVIVARIQDLIARYGERFARRVLGPDELVEYQRRHGRGSHGPAPPARRYGYHAAVRGPDHQRHRPARRV